MSYASNGNVEATVKPNVTNADKPDRHPSLSLRANIHFATLCWTPILAGWNDNYCCQGYSKCIIGQREARPLDFLCMCNTGVHSIGNMFLTKRISFGEILVIGSVFQVIAYCTAAAAVPFPAFVFAYTINGCGMALEAAQYVGYIVRFKDNPGLRMGLLMAGYVHFALLVYTLLAIALEFIVLFVPSLIGNAIAVACIGFLLGTMYPVAMYHAGQVLPQWLLTGALGWVAGGGQAGSALIPFITGAIAQKAGIPTSKTYTP